MSKIDYSTVSNDELLIGAQLVNGHSQLIDELAKRLNATMDELDITKAQLESEKEAKVALGDLECPICKAHLALSDGRLETLSKKG